MPTVMDGRDAAALAEDRAHAADLRDPNIAQQSRGPGRYETASRAAEAKRHTDELVSLYGRFIGVAEKTFTRYASGSRQGMDQLEESVRVALEETAREEAKAWVGKAPYGKVVLVALELSNAFAAGVGEGIAAAHAKSRAGSAVPRTPEEEALYERKYLARATGEVNNVLLSGLEKLSGAVIDMLFKEASAALKKSVSDVAGQIARQLPRHHDLFAIVNADVKERASSIPHGRAGVERITFSFASRLFVQQYASEDTAKRMAPILGAIKSKEPLDVALTGGILQVLFEGTYAQYKRYVHVDRAVDELRDELKNAARALIDRARENGAQVEIGATVETDGNVIRLPQALYDQITTPGGGISAATYARLLAREAEYQAARQRMTAELRDIAAAFQRQVWRADPDLREAEAVGLQNRLVELRNQGVRSLQLIERHIVEEFGAYVEGYGDVHTRLTVGAPFPQYVIPIPTLEPLR